jgi:crossover junction endodeoxyribonuclease RusA
MTTSHITLSLPWPPSTNRYWRHVGHRTLLSRDGRAYKANVLAAIREQQGTPTPMTGPVKVLVALHPPDRRRRDIDNHAGKALLDALQHAGILEDDSQVVELHAFMLEPRKGGLCVVEVTRHA